MSNRRALHFVLKVASLRKNINFFRDVLKMKVLRHEEFDKGCEAACNGPYSGRWSKTMIGYGSEDDHFVLELTYNYSVNTYRQGNDLKYMKISLNGDSFDQIKELTRNLAKNSQEASIEVYSPDGYKFLLHRKQPHSNSINDISEVALSCSNLTESSEYWSGLLKMPRVDDATDARSAIFSYDSNKQASLRLIQIVEPIDHGSAYGRIAFSCNSEDLKDIEKICKDGNRKILVPYISLDTPGKATVQVVILADPDGHEICFVGDEGFRELSKIDDHANDYIEKCMSEDKSDEWFKSKNLTKDSC